MPRSLFSRTALTLVCVFLIFQVATSWVFKRTLIDPVAQRSADDLAGLIVLSAQTWVELPPQTRPDFEAELARQHGLRLTLNNVGASLVATDFAFRDEIETALTRRLQRVVVLRGTPGSRAAWLEIPLGGYILRAGFFPDRYAVQPPLAAMLVFALGTLLSLATALLLVRRIAQPLAAAVAAARQVGAGELPEPLPETGPAELAELAQRFNVMASEVRALLENRTTLLAGISHDLRTPMTRLQLTLELLRDDPSAARIDRAQSDLADMNTLIAGYLELARSSRAESAIRLDLAAVLRELAAEAGAVWVGPAHCPGALGPVAFKQIVANLLGNALRYGGERPPELRLECRAGDVQVSVRDYGPGIPSDQLEKVFRPFYRLEGSRSTDTGGAGLGLALVRQLALANGWNVTLKNHPEGGLEVRLCVPGKNADQGPTRSSSE